MLEFWHHRTRRLKLLISFALALAIVLMVVLLPLGASALTITISGPTSVDKLNTMCLTTTLTFQSGERIPIANIQAIISGATNITIEFDTNGNVTSVTGDLDASHIGASISRMETYDYGYGYRVGYQSGYGYGFGYGYGYSAADTVVRYVICFDSDYLTPGDHNLQVKVNTGESVKPSFSSGLHAFHVDGETITLYAGWNNVNWQRPAATFLEVDNLIGNIGVLSWWDRANQRYESYVHGFPWNEDFIINPGDAVWVYKTTTETFEM